MTRKSSSDPTNDSHPAGTGGFLGQVGLFESANGLPHGPIAILVAIAAALVIYPLTRIVRAITRR